MSARPARWLPHPWLSLTLLLMWLVLMNRVSLGHLLLGGVLAVAIPGFTRLYWVAGPRVQRHAPMLRLLPLFLWDVLIANITVALLILNPWRTPRPAWILIPLDIADPYAITTLASMITLTPGTLSAKLTPDRLQLLVHVLDTDDPEAEVHNIKQRYERPLKEIFG